MKIYSKTKLTELELEEEEFNTSVESYNTRSELLNTIKEVFELTEYTTEIISYYENGNKKAVNTFNYLNDSAIINVALYNFLELITTPSAITFLIGADPEIENIAYVPTKVRISNLIDYTIDSFNLNLEASGSVTSSDVLLEQLKNKIESEKEENKN